MSDKTHDLESLFEAARQIESAEERAAFLDQSCGHDWELRHHVERLLQSNEQAGSFLAKPLAAVDATLIGQSHSDLAASLDAGFAQTFGTGEAVVLGDAGHSVLRTLAESIAVPRVALREPTADATDPIVRPKSSEIPKSDSDSRYQLQGEIARGGMGAIIKGRDTDLGRDLAIKVLLDSHKNKPEVIQRFIEEAQIGGQLQHPGIAPVYELGQFADKRPFFSMKLVKGETLSKLLANRETPAQDRGRFLGIFEQVCQTMAYAHSRGVIHRDLKPANIMVGAFGEVQVMDWGLAKVLAAGGVADEKMAFNRQKGQSIIQTMRRQTGSDVPGTFGTMGSQTQMGSVMGTPAYMPPEQALGEIDQMNERADVFGLGAILCEILTGKPPYVADGGTEVFRMASRGKLEGCFLRLDACHADDELVALTKHCLELEPGNRPRDAGMLAGKVTGYLESVETKLREAEVKGAAEAARADAQAAQAAAERQRAHAESQRAEAESARAGEERKRRRVSLALAACILLLMTLGSGGWLYLLRQEANRQMADANAQRTHAREMQTLAEQRDEQRKTAELAKATAVTAQQQAEKDRAAAVEAKQMAEAAEERGRRLLYTTDMQLAPLLWKDRDATLAQLRSRLDAHNPDENPDLKGKADLRGFEWSYFQNLSENGAAVFPGHSVSVIDGVFLSNDQLVTLDQNSQVRRWDIGSMDEVEASRRDLPGGPRGEVSVLSPDGRLAALADGDKVHVYDTTTGRKMSSIDSHKREARKLIFSPDSDRLVIVDDKIRWCHATSGQLLASFNRKFDEISGLAMSADGQTLGVIGIGKYRAERFSLFRLDSSKKSVTPLAENLGSIGSLHSAALSSDGQRIAVCARLSGGFTIYDTTTRRAIAGNWAAHASEVTAIAFSGDDKLLATADSEGTIKIWRIDEERDSQDPALLTFKGHRGAIRSVRFSSDGKRFVTTSEDKTARVWDLRNTDASIRPLERTRSSLVVRYSPTGELIAVGEPGHIGLWDAATGQLVRELPTDEKDGVQCVAFSPTNHRLLAVGYGGRVDVSFVALWDIDAGTELARLSGANDVPGFKQGANNSAVASLAFSPDGMYLVAGFGSKNLLQYSSQPSPLKVWEVESRRLVRRLHGHTGYCVSLDFSPDGTMLASGSRDGTAILWSTKTWAAARTLQNPDQGFNQSDRGMVEDVAFSPDGKTLALASREGTVQLWEVTTGEHLESLKGHASAVTAVAFSPDGRTLASGSSDRTVRLWNVESRRELMQLDSGNVELGKLSSLTFSSNGQQLLAGGDRSVIWSAQPNVWNDAGRGVEQLQRMLNSNADFPSRIQMMSENLRLHATLEKLDSKDVHAQAALAATQANWHASRQEWPAAVQAFDHLVTVEPIEPAAWLRTPGLLRLATALLHQDRPRDAAALLKGGADRRNRDGLSAVDNNVALGFVSMISDGAVQVREVLPGSPAGRSNLAPGDIILEVNQTKLTEKTMSGLREVLVGEAGTSVRLTVRHAGKKQPEVIELTREKFIADPTTGDLLHSLRIAINERLAQKPNDAGLLELRAELAGQWSDAQAQVDDYTAAIEALTQPTAETPSQSGDLRRLSVRRGNAYVALRQWQRAVDDYARANIDLTANDELLANQELAQTATVAGVDPIVPILDLSGTTQWRYTTSSPVGDWMNADFSDVDWNQGVAVFGTPDIRQLQTNWNTPKIWQVHTIWNTSKIWLRQQFQFTRPANQPRYILQLLCDDAAKVFLNGEPLTNRKSHTFNKYVTIELEPQQVALLVEGTNTLAVHCHNPGHTGYIDVKLLALPAIVPLEKLDTILAPFENRHPWQRIATLYKLCGDQQAINKLLTRQPQLAGVLGDLYTQGVGEEQEWDRAVGIYSHGITDKTSNVELLSKRARAYEALENWEAAAADWSRAATGNPDGPRLLSEFARRLATEGQSQMANDLFHQTQALYEQMLQSDPANDVVAGELAQLLLDKQVHPGEFAVWNFDSGLGRWGVPQDCRLSCNDGVLTVFGTGENPQFMTLINGSAGGQALVLRYRSHDEHQMKVFWEDTTGGFSETHSQIYTIPAAQGEWREMTLPFACEGELRALRLDPKIVAEHPLEIDSLVLRGL